VFRSGNRRRVGGLVVVTIRGGGDEVRLGLVVGKGVGSAVERNRAKRRIRHAFARVRVDPGTDVVVVASPRVVTAAFDELVEWLSVGCGQQEV
jgi:ribonuclease P protein component